MSTLVSVSQQVEFFEVIDEAGKVLLRTFSMDEARGFRRSWLSLGNVCRIESRIIASIIVDAT